MSTILICGSREFTNEYGLFEELKEYFPIDRILSGGARGADKLAEQFAHEHEIKCSVFEPDWKPNGTYDPFAGYARNLRMLNENPDLVVAGWDGLSRGTLHTISEAVQRGIPVSIVPDTSRDVGA